MAKISLKIDKETLSLLDKLAIARGKLRTDILRDWINLGRAIDENSGYNSKLIILNSSDNGGNVRIPIGHLTRIT